MNIINSNRSLSRFIVTMMILLSHVIYAQDSDTSSNTTYNFRKGLWALQFRIDNNFMLSSFQGGTISVKYHVSDKSAVRFGFSVSGQYELDKEEYVNGIIVESQEKYHQESLTFDLQYIHYPSANKAAMFYWGFGPSLSGSHLSTLLPETSRSYRIGMGLTVIFGVEYIITEHLGLTAEYSTMVKYVRSYNRYESAGHTYKYTGEDIIVDTNAVKFGVSVYL
ncbi:hypothetical protein MUP95_08075 [bacterium]|nr:hypothetical protein [bacterium]